MNDKIDQDTLPKVHCFICTSCTFKIDGAQSTPETAAIFRKNLKEMCKKRFDKNQVRINQSGCLNLCESGISSVIYPQKILRTNLRPGDEQTYADFIDQLLKTN